MTDVRDDDDCGDCDDSSLEFLYHSINWLFCPFRISFLKFLFYFFQSGGYFKTGDWGILEFLVGD